MRIYAAADLHGKRGHLRTLRTGISETRPDVLVLAGDILRHGRGRHILTALAALSLPVLMVRGNSDPVHVERSCRSMGALHWLHLETHTFGGFDFLGVGGTVPVPFYSLAGWGETRTLKRAETMLHSRSIFVAHPPPRGCCDKVMGRFHAGSPGIARLIHRAAPAVMICGHIHEAAGIDRQGATLVVNCALGKGRRGAFIDVGEGQPPRAELL